MVNTVPLTEMVDLAADELHLVKTGANGFPELVAKAVADVKEITEKSQADPEYDDSTELGQRIDALLGEVAKGAGVALCGQSNCVICGDALAKFPFDDSMKAKLTSRARAGLSSSDFVFPGKRKYPIHDASHARNALSRAGGKKVESTVRAAVSRRYPNIDMAKSPGVPDSSTKVPGVADALPQWPATRHDHLGDSVDRPATESPYNGDRSGQGPLHRPWNVGLQAEVTGMHAPTPDRARTTHDPQPEGIGGAGAATIPVLDRVVKPANQVFPGSMNAFLTRKMAYSISQLSDMMARIAEQRMTKEPWIEGANPAAKAPGDGDDDDMDQIAQNLTDIAKTVQSKDSAAIKTKLDTALSLVARLAFAGDSETDLAKAGYDLSAFSPQALSLAHDQISDILAARPTIQSTEDDMITQEQMGMVTDAARKAAVEAADAAFKTNFKSLKKTLKKLAKANGNSLGSTSNNKGEVTEGDIRGIQTQRRTADDIDIPGAQMTRTSGAAGSAPASSASAGDVTKTEGAPGGAAAEVKKDKKKVKKSKKGDKSLKKQVKEMNGLLVKALSRPAAGGPMLTGNPSGAAPATQEGRQGEPVAKGAEDKQIDDLQKEQDELMKAWDHTQAPSQRLQQVSYQLTRMKLSKSHREGTDEYVPINAAGR